MDLLSVSIGFTIPESNIPWAPGFMGEVTQRVRREAGIAVASAWGFGTPSVAEEAVRSGQLDLAMIGRAHLGNPNWSYSAAQALGVERAAWTLPAPYAHWLERYR